METCKRRILPFNNCHDCCLTDFLSALPATVDLLVTLDADRGVLKISGATQWKLYIYWCCFSWRSCFSPTDQWAWWEANAFFGNTNDNVVTVQQAEGAEMLTLSQSYWYQRNLGRKQKKAQFLSRENQGLHLYSSCFGLLRASHGRDLARKVCPISGKNRTAGTCDSVDEPGGHYAKRSKPGTERRAHSSMEWKRKKKKKEKSWIHRNREEWWLPGARRWGKLLVKGCKPPDIRWFWGLNAQPDDYS